MKMGREEKEVIVPPPKPGLSFMDATFAQDDALRSGTERGANEGPFLESIGGS
jgi:hypothetical protein